MIKKSGRAFSLALALTLIFLLAAGGAQAAAPPSIQTGRVDIYPAGADQFDIILSGSQMFTASALIPGSEVNGVLTIANHYGRPLALGLEAYDPDDPDGRALLDYLRLTLTGPNGLLYDGPLSGRVNSITGAENLQSGPFYLGRLGAGRDMVLGIKLTVPPIAAEGAPDFSGADAAIDWVLTATDDFVADDGDDDDGAIIVTPPVTDVPEEGVPTDPGVEIPEEDVPLTPVIDIVDDDVPLGELPKTGT
ncbi:MAG: hypothetical protein LBS10_05285 [Gracilibacteraceae bacterium]|jgi:hypothetical protein|nr:hypothetical protein [Gracilibacteraceae bacterium]